MQTKSPLIAALASIFLFFACSSSSSPEEFEFSSSSIQSSSSITISSSSIIRSSSSATISSSSSVILSSSSATVSSSSVIRSSSSATISSSSVIRSSSSVTASIDCSREGLEAAVDSYLAAMTAGDYTIMSLTPTAKYIENDNTAKMNYMAGSYNRVIPFGEGLWETPLAPDFHRNLIDVDECATFTEIIIANSNPQYILGVSLKVSGSQISEVSAVVTQDGDWLFNADNYLRYSKDEDWSLLPENQRRTRQELHDDAFAYFAYFGDKTVEAPWGIPCARLEGGAYTNPMNSNTASCNVGVPDQNIQLSSISYLADTDYGMIVLLFYFGGADSHLFRILPTGYRYIHTLTAMKQSDFNP